MRVSDFMMDTLSKVHRWIETMNAIIAMANHLERVNFFEDRHHWVNRDLSEINVSYWGDDCEETFLRKHRELREDGWSLIRLHGDAVRGPEGDCCYANYEHPKFPSVQLHLTLNSKTAHYDVIQVVSLDLAEELVVA